MWETKGPKTAPAALLPAVPAFHTFITPEDMERPRQADKLAE
ncbi:MAG: hypothetical protein AAF141_06615 [Pseudomonadota bacterium]